MNLNRILTFTLLLGLMGFFTYTSADKAADVALDRFHETAAPTGFLRCPVDTLPWEEHPADSLLGPPSVNAKCDASCCGSTSCSASGRCACECDCSHCICIPVV